ncbi:MAG: hypothetical protein V7K77_02100 [Nostoc sp.]
MQIYCLIFKAIATGASQFLFCTERITVIAIAQRVADKQSHGL